jgi:S-adenosylmethionine:tRNA ribosyltransferase-isomerase
MKLAQFDYELPEKFIAQDPVEPRDSSKLLVFDSSTGEVSHRRFRDVAEYLGADDVLVVNRTKVIPARILFDVDGREVEVFRLGKVSEGLYKCLVKPGKLFRVGATRRVNDRLSCEVIEENEDGTRGIRFLLEGGDGEGVGAGGGAILEDLLEEAGEAPLPPYIKNSKASFDRYQTVYSKEKGSVAAPTAGLHFTPELLERLVGQGVSLQEVILHVGLGTFLPVKTEKIEDHDMHSEYFEISPETSDALKEAKAGGKRIVCVGTTSVRVVESSELEAKVGDTDIFIYPGYQWKVVDRLITNFHLPKSTLIMLVASFLESKGVENGTEKVLELYEIAKKEGYRFYSFGDAMMII